MKPLLLISEIQQVADDIQSCLKTLYQIDRVTFDADIPDLLGKKRYELVFIDAHLLGEMGKEKEDRFREGLQKFWSVYPMLQIIVISSQDSIRESVEAVKAGASNYITYPINPEELNFVTRNVEDHLRIQSELNYLRGHFWQKDSVDLIRTNTPDMMKLYHKVRSVAPTKSTVLLLGETGTGKGVVARLIHRHSTRKERQFISVHCGAISDTLLESELFGHEKGAFTGAIKRKLGKFEIAHKGTIFLDEIGAISSSMQIKLLKVLQEKTFERVGGEESIEVDVRIIAATNADLKKMSNEGSFRSDLYYRLNVFPVELPPLRKRKEDIELLSTVFLNRLNKYYSRGIHNIHPRVLEAFRNYSWPGNIRELENLIERAYILEDSNVLTPDSFPGEFFEEDFEIPAGFIDLNMSLDEIRRHTVEKVEIEYLKGLLALYNGKIKETAESAKIGVRQLHKLLTKYNIKKEEFKTKGSSLQIGINGSDPAKISDHSDPPLHQ